MEVVSEIPLLFLVFFLNAVKLKCILKTINLVVQTHAEFLIYCCSEFLIMNGLNKVQSCSATVH